MWNKRCATKMWNKKCWTKYRIKIVEKIWVTCVCDTFWFHIIVLHFLFCIFVPHIWCAIMLLIACADQDNFNSSSRLKIGQLLRRLYAKMFQVCYPYKCSCTTFMPSCPLNVDEFLVPLIFVLQWPCCTRIVWRVLATSCSTFLFCIGHITLRGCSQSHGNHICNTYL